MGPNINASSIGWNKYDKLGSMRSPSFVSFFTCSMLKPNDTETKFVDLFLAEDSENNHSSAFSRLMMEAINKGIKTALNDLK